MMGGSGASLPALNNLCRRLSVNDSTCSVIDCKEPARRAGLCGAHHQRLLRTGSVQADMPVKRLRPRDPDAPPTYDTIHHRLRSQKGSANRHACVECGDKARHWAYDHTDPNELIENGRVYSADLDRYWPMCRSCHQSFDMEKTPDRYTGQLMRTTLKTRCVNGHGYTSENTYLWNGYRFCRMCRRENDKCRAPRSR